MKIISKNPKANEFTVLLESMDDLWHMFNIIEKGDTVYAMTHRREEKKTDKLRPERGKKKPMRLGIAVSDLEFHEFSDRLRVHGVIKDGPQDLGSFHTLNLTEGERISIIKEKWMDIHIRRLEEAVAATRNPLIIFVTIDYDEAQFAYLRQSGVQEVAKIVSGITGKRHKSSPDAKKEFYKEVLEKLKGLVQGPTPIVILGPGFAKEEFFEFGRASNQDIFSQSIVQGTGEVGLTGIHEALKEGLAPKILKDTRVGYETTLIEQLLSEIAKNGNFAYGPKEVENATLAGAVSVLLVLDRLVRQKKVDELLKVAEEKRADIVIINAHNDAGRKLDSLGGVAAILRYKIN